MKRSLKTFWTVVFLAASLAAISAQKPRSSAATTRISANTLVQIIRAEDERRWDDHLRALLADKDVKVRKRAALAVGRIGDERALPALDDLLKNDNDSDVRQMAAFAIGEIESPAGAEPLLEVLGVLARPRGPQPGSPAGVERSGRAPELDGRVRARAVEALGKIAAALPESDKDLKRVYGEAILNPLKFETGRRSMPDRLTILLGLTAALRAKPDGAGPVVVKFLDYSDPRIVADALNTMARLRLKDGNGRVRQLLNNSDAIVRANAARVIGAAEHKEVFEAIVDRAVHDDDLRVRVSAIRALASLKDTRGIDPLIRRGQILIDSALKREKDASTHPVEQNELLEIATTLGRVISSESERNVRDFLLRLGNVFDRRAPEVEIALARVAPAEYWADKTFLRFTEPQFLKISLQRSGSAIDWRTMAALAQGLTEVAALLSKQWNAGGSVPEAIGVSQVMGQRRTQMFLSYVRRKRLAHDAVPIQAIPDVLRAYSAYKSDDTTRLLLQFLSDPDVIVRSTAAELLADLTSNENSRALGVALRAELPRTEEGEMNDAALALLDALAKQKNNAAIKSGLNSSDHLIRRKAVALLKANGAGNFSDRIGTVKTRNTEADYRRAIARIGKHVTATVITSKGSFTIEFLPEDAPLTVDNFIQLARKGFFNGQTIPRVVPNFVIQAGDPRGDTNGGPGYQIRCEINEVPYERGAVGMALSGKDTGGSQWFVTHSPQPHLDGGYTVFGHVIKGMDVVDNIARGDIIRRVIVNER